MLTAGKLSILDIFDINSIAHDLRAQFMNSVLMTHGACDYAADAGGYRWGYRWSLAAKCDADNWTLRRGCFLQPKDPNLLKLDARIGPSGITVAIS